MQSYDISHLPPPLHDAVLHVLATLVAAFPLAPAEAVLVDVPSTDGTPRFPRSPTELRVLEALATLAPMPATPLQVAALVNRPHLEVRTILQGLAMLETVKHPSKGFYAHRPPEDGVAPSAPFARQIAAICTPHAKE